MRALGQNPVNAEVLKVLGNPRAEGEREKNNLLGVIYFNVHKSLDCHYAENTFLS